MTPPTLNFMMNTENQPTPSECATRHLLAYAGDRTLRCDARGCCSLYGRTLKHTILVWFLYCQPLICDCLYGDWMGLDIHSFLAPLDRISVRNSFFGFIDFSPPNSWLYHVCPSSHPVSFCCWLLYHSTSLQQHCHNQQNKEHDFTFFILCCRYMRFFFATL